MSIKTIWKPPGTKLMMCGRLRFPQGQVLQGSHVGTCQNTKIEHVAC